MNTQPLVNQSHSRQDITRLRQFDSARARYRFANNLLPDKGIGQRLLDVGGGAGEFCALARYKGYVTTLVDGNRNSVAAEIGRGSDAKYADLTIGLPEIPNSAYDVVVSLEVIEHIVTAEALLAEMSRVLRPNGILILSTPNFGYLKDRLSYLIGRDVKEEGYHFRFYTKRKLDGMFAAVGLTVEKRASIGSALGVNLALRCLSFGRMRIGRFSCPSPVESWLAETFVWRARKQ